jgi:LPS-assembly protein
MLAVPRRLSTLLASILLAAVLGFVTTINAVHAQNAPEKIALLANAVHFDPVKGQLIATGNVEIFFSQGVLRTQEVIFHQKDNRIEVPQPLILNAQQEMTLAAASAVFDLDFENGLIQSAQILLQQQFQMAAATYIRKDNRFNIFDEAVASTCYICEKNQTPFWQIRSQRIIHDDSENRIYFENATLEFLGFPIMYVPSLRVPDPSVDRASGFLVPRFSTSNTLGYGVEIPYYFTLGDHADLTVTPSFTTKESLLVSGQYRRQFRRGKIEIDGTIALADPLSSTHFRSSLEATGKFNLDRDFILDFGVDLASDDDFRDDYSLGDEDRLTSFVELSRTDEDSYFSVGSSRIQSLRPNEIDEEIPFVLPELYFRQRFADPFLGGDFSVEANAVSLLRDDSSQMLRMGGELSWRRNWVSDQGLTGSYYAAVAGNVYSTNNHADYGSISDSAFLPLIAADISWPLAKQVGSVTHVVEPIAQLVWAPDTGNSSINEDSVQVEFESSNLFSYNRFPGFDETEAGARLNLGLSYMRYDPSGWTFGGTMGRVFRQRDLGQFDATETTGLNAERSDYVTALYVSFPNKFDLTNRSLFDEDFSVSKNETLVTYSSERWAVDASYVWLEEDFTLNQSDKQHEMGLEIDYFQNSNWTYSANWKQNLNIGKAIEGGFGIRYKNECVTVNLTLDLEFSASGIENPKRELGLTVALTGLGTGKSKSKPAHRCAF